MARGGVADDGQAEDDQHGGRDRAADEPGRAALPRFGGMPSAPERGCQHQHDQARSCADNDEDHSSQSAALPAGRADRPPTASRDSRPAQRSGRDRNARPAHNAPMSHDRGGRLAAAGARFSAGRDCISSLRLGAAVCADRAPMVRM